MADRGRSHNRGDSPGRGGRDNPERERSQSRERSDRAESSYTTGHHQEVKQQQESGVAHLWMTEEEPNLPDLYETLRTLSQEQIKEIISGCNFDTLVTTANEAIENLSRGQKRQNAQSQLAAFASINKGYSRILGESPLPKITDPVKIQLNPQHFTRLAQHWSSLESHTQIASELYGMIQDNESELLELAALATLESAIHQKWEQNHPDVDRSDNDS